MLNFSNKEGFKLKGYRRIEIEEIENEYATAEVVSEGGPDFIPDQDLSSRVEEDEVPSNLVNNLRHHVLRANHRERGHKFVRPPYDPFRTKY